eukprot:Gb_17574 [translate_table: standard]
MSGENGLDAISKCLPHANIWIQSWFMDCIYTPWEMAAFLIGLSSVFFWLIAQVPQFMNNIARQSADALSPWFLIQWLAGDSFNFLGCLLTGDQLVTETITATYFIFSDCVILSQYLYYGYKGRGMLPGAYGSDSDESLHKPQKGYYEALQNGAASQLERVLEGCTCQKAIETRMEAEEIRYPQIKSGDLAFQSGVQIICGQLCIEESQACMTTKAGAIESKIGTEANDVNAGDRRNPKHCSCVTSQGVHARHNGACSSKSNNLHRHGQDCSFANKKRAHLQRVVMEYGLEHGFPSSVKFSKRHMFSSGKDHEDLTQHVSKHEFVASRVRKSRVKVAFCLTGLLILGSLSWKSSLGIPRFEGGSTTAWQSSIPGGNQGIVLGRRGLKGLYEEDQSVSERLLLAVSGSEYLSTRQIGLILGWASSGLYLSSRVSQLLKNRSRKSAEGLSLGMIACAAMANLTYGFSILMRITSWGDFFGKAPWLLGSLGTVSLDLAIFIQAHYLSYHYGKVTTAECSPLLA